jgi:stage II sporulation protein AB (anti-sigma F factor)
VDELAELKTVISEAVTNCTVHAYKDTIGLIYITARYSDDGVVWITIKDCGCGIDDTATAREPLYTTCTTGERAGMGFTIMESFSDKLRVVSKPGRGTRLEIYKKISIRT